AFGYGSQLSTVLGNQPALLTGLETALQAGGFPTVTVTPFNALLFEQSVSQNGLPASLVQKLTQLGADRSTVEHLRRLAVVQDINAIAGSFPQRLTDPALITALQGAARALDPIAVTSAAVAGTAGAPVAGVVASFTDASSPHPVGNYSAMISWGDGNTSAG